MTPGVRRHRIDDAPVYETRLRVPTGDVVQRVAVANDGRNRTLVFEFENVSSEAVAVALVGRAFAVELVATRDAVRLDGQVWIQPERQAGGVVAVSGPQEPWSEIHQDPTTGPVSASTAAPVSASDGKVAAAAEVAAGLVMAVPHRQTVKFQVAIEGEVPARSATPAEVASGWRAVTADALSVDVADAELGVAWRRILGDLVVQAGSDDPRSAAEAAPILDMAGLDREADRARATVVAATEMGLLSDVAAVAGLRALASRELRTGKNSGLDELAEVLVAGSSNSLDSTTANLLAWALEANARRVAAGAPSAFGSRGQRAGARRVAADVPSAFGSRGRRAGAHRVAADAQRLAASVDPEVAYQPSTPAALAAVGLLSVLVDDSCPGRIELLPEMPPEWFGRPVDVRGLGTLWGRISFSVRWHGHRPALLWERTRGHDNVELRCGSIDPAWSTVERQGETLLAEPLWAPHE